jgi:RimJ/RimL family protein N-acetyltransferase
MTITSFQSKKAGLITVERDQTVVTIRTSRLILKSLNQYNRDDLITQCVQLMGSPDNTALFGDGRAWDHNKIIDFVDSSLMQWNDHPFFGVFIAHNLETNEFVGQLHINYTPEYFFTLFQTHQNAAEIGYILDQPFWGKGYATEMAIAGKKYIKHIRTLDEFNALKRPVDEIVATAHPDNHGSTHILRKILKNEEAETIYRYDNPRLFFYKRLKKDDTSCEATPTIDSTMNLHT